MNPLVLLLLAQLNIGGWENFELWHFKNGDRWLINKTNFNFNYFGEQYLLSGGLEYHAYLPEGTAPFDKLNKLQKYWLEATYRSTTLRFGTFTDNIGRGFLLYAGEEESAFLDRFVNGVEAKLQIAPFSLKGFWGKPESYVFYDLRNDTSDVLWGGSVKFERLLANGTTVELGNGYLGLMDSVKHIAHFISTFGGAYRENFGIFAEFAYRRGWDKLLFKDSTGYAVYVGLTYATPNGLNADLEFGKMSRFGHEYMLPPTLNHMGFYLNNGRDETGYSVSLSYPLGKFMANAQFSILKGRFSGLDGWIYNHFLEFSSDRLVLDLEYADIREAWAAGIHDRIEKAVRFKWFAPKEIEISTLLRHRFDAHETNYIDSDLSVGWSPTDMLTFVGTVQKRSGDSTGVWTRFEVFFQFDIFQLSVTIGKQRRELVCSGGVCRYEPAFDGVRIKTLISF